MWGNVIIKNSDKAEKKNVAIFTNKEGKKKTIHFGQRTADDYTKTKDKKQRARYLQRHRKRENWDRPDTAGSLSRWILWGDSVSKRQNIASFKRRFKLL
jgi:hypothetical protein